MTLYDAIKKAQREFYAHFPAHNNKALEEEVRRLDSILADFVNKQIDVYSDGLISATEFAEAIINRLYSDVTLPS